MNALAYLKPENGPVGRSLNAWFDLAPSGLAIPLALLCFVVVWGAFQVIAFSSVGLHPDMLEAYAWGLHPSAGYYKHPPLSGLIAGAWFSLFPPTDWAFDLLAMTNAAAALFATDLIARRHLKGDKRLLVLLFLLLTPFYQFHAERFSTNQVLLSSWPGATYCFLRAFETRGLCWSAGAGVAASLAMLGKYYSIFLIAGFAAAVLAHPDGRVYLRSASPWLSAAVGLLVLAPHLRWLIAAGWMPFTSAYGIHGGAPLDRVLWKDTVYVIEAVLYVVVPLAVYVLAVRPTRALLRETLWPLDADGRMLAGLLAVPLILPAMIAPLIGAALTPLWTMSAWFLLPIVLLRPSAAVISRVAAIRVAALVATMTLGSLAAAPLVAWRYREHGTKEYREYYRPVAAEVTNAWHHTAGSPLRIVGGDLYLVSAATFYSPDHPDSVPGFSLAAAPWVTEERLSSEGFAAICIAAHENCVEEAKRRALGKHNVRFIDRSGGLERFFFAIVPPERQ